MGGRKQSNLELKKGTFIVGEGLTEQYYFSHIKQINNCNWKVEPRFFGKTDITQIEKTVKKLILGEVTVVCIFDADVSKRNQAEKKKLTAFKNKYKNSSCVIICDSFPSIEFWFLLHFVKTNKYFANSSLVEKELKNYLKGYSKTHKFLQNPEWVDELTKHTQTAIANAKSIDIDEGSVSYSNIYKAFEL